MAEEIKTVNRKGRDAGIDLIRVVACLLVVGTHVDVMGTEDSSKLFIRLLFADGVTLFFILSGFFFFRKGFTESLKRALSSIVFPGIAVMLLSYQFSPFIRGEKTILYCLTHLNFDICAFLTDLFSWGGNIRESMAAHLWYIFTYLQLVLAYPLVKPLYSEAPQCTDIGEKDRFRKYRWFIIGFIF
ncbi:putative acyltransferase [Lachnospiraceae bacterium JC7]|nr:putative acyltransferase [Lachnospiraceae bacterium JC7]